jgi:UDP-N-acetylglucosamine:LPS N-acetylglucosamine transferase
VARTRIPCKLAAYFAAGRPVLFHGPKYASPAKFIEENNAGICCYSLESEKILEKLTLLAGDKELYAKLAKNGKIAFQKYLTLDILKSALASFLGAPFTHESN